MSIPELQQESLSQSQPGLFNQYFHVLSNLFLIKEYCAQSGQKQIFKDFDTCIVI